MSTTIIINLKKSRDNYTLLQYRIFVKWQMQNGSKILDNTFFTFRTFHYSQSTVYQVFVWMNVWSICWPEYHNSNLIYIVRNPNTKNAFLLQAFIKNLWTYAYLLYTKFLIYWKYKKGFYTYNGVKCRKCVDFKYKKM